MCVLVCFGMKEYTQVGGRIQLVQRKANFLQGKTAKTKRNDGNTGNGEHRHIKIVIRTGKNYV